MLTAKPQLNLKNAREYFREHLSAGDYYAEDQKVTGEWFGLGAEKLGLKGAVKEADFLALCDGFHPATGKRLTARQNSVRRESGRAVANRRVFYDFTLSPPKSVSVVGLMRDGRILELHNRAVRIAMAELEKFAQVRLRRGGQRGERDTGNLLGAAFRHDTSRELDPHLHTHCVVFNATLDAKEGCWKALEVRGMYRAQRFAENLYYHELCRGLRGLGYEIENNARDFELKGIMPSTIARFSKRHHQIDVETQKRIEREGLRGRLKELRGQVAEAKRQRKMKDSTADRLRGYWVGQLPTEEAKALTALKPVAKPASPAPDVAAVVAWADEHVFERKAVATDHELWSAALARGRGSDMDLAAIQAETDRRGYLREPGTRRITSSEVLSSEMAVVQAARQGRNWLAPLNSAYRPSPKLSAEQRSAVECILGSQDFITLFRGGAGTGKSFTLAEVWRGLESAGHPVVVLAPQRQQVAGLCSDGIPADTLARCLRGNSLPARAVVVVDEAGQIGARQLGRLVELVQAAGGRLILSGDTRQHGAVEASDALLAIERYSGARPAVIHDIRRQDPARARSRAERRHVARYRAAVKAASAGRIAESFDRLDRLGCIRETTLGDRAPQIAAEYVARTTRGENALVVAQTWADVNALNETIRSEMIAKGRLAAGIRLKTYQAVDLGEAQKRDPRHYREIRFAHFVQRYGRFAKGDILPIVDATSRGLVLLKDGRRSTMSYRYAARILVAAEREVEIAVGDRLQLKFNGRSVEGRPLANGELVRVRHIHSDGSVAIESSQGEIKTLSPRQRLFNLGYAVTSYASQGKTVDTVLVADAGCAAVADRRHWYVAISRARKNVLVFTSDKEALRDNIEQSGDRPLALDLKLGEMRRTTRVIMERNRLHGDFLRRTVRRMRRIIRLHSIRAQPDEIKIRI